MNAFSPPTTGHHIVITRKAIRVSWKLAGTLALAFLFLYGTVTLLQRSFAAKTDAPEINPPATAWGRLKRSVIQLEPPPAYVTPATCSTEPAPWVFAGSNRTSLLDRLTAAGIDSETRDALATNALCEESNCLTRPTVDDLQRMPAAARATIEGALVLDPDGLKVLNVFDRRVDEPDAWRVPGLDPAVQKLLDGLAFRQGDVMVLTDVAVACSRAPSDEQKQNLMRVLMRNKSLLVTLHVQPGDDVDALERYWSWGKPRPELRSLLSAAADAPGGVDLDVAQLLPPFVRSHLYTFSSPQDPPRDCYYSALNFYTDTPEESFVDGPTALRALNGSYAVVQGDGLRLGDILVFIAPDGQPSHAAVYVADDIVFTKNGSSYYSPWILMSLDELKAKYPRASHMSPMRRRDLMNVATR